MLIGGLGVGFTLAAALRRLGPDAEVVVAELVPGLVEWNRGPLGEHAGHPLRDTRVTICEVDVAVILRAEVRAFDAIMLDVDNGPEGLTHKKNDWLYSKAGLNVSYQALRPKGLLAVWSAAADRAFTETPEQDRVRGEGGSGAGAPRKGRSPPHLGCSKDRALEKGARLAARPPLSSPHAFVYVGARTRCPTWSPRLPPTPSRPT